MRTLVLMVTVMAAALVIGPASPQEAGKIKELQKERIATLREMGEIINRLYKSGNASLEEIYDAKLLLLKAELDTAGKQPDRIALYKNFVDASKKLEKLAEASVEAGRGTVASVLKFRARRLEAEIHLEQAKLKEARDSK